MVDSKISAIPLQQRDLLTKSRLALSKSTSLDITSLPHDERTCDSTPYRDVRTYASTPFEQSPEGSPKSRITAQGSPIKYGSSSSYLASKAHVSTDHVISLQLLQIW